ncbi:uncharacterized protein LOC107042165 [Diachasma alloeum]|uniref:uncharacterized protein LOC107042165 n=1 Tax=Diachasma alloeum TaxID=454923 RepID=UPI00073810F0|nr:uncharacterized protein LOC107042165 [Diachasma alloeum]
MEKYSDILCRVKKDIPSEQARDCVDKIHRTATGDMLIILSRNATDGAPQLRTAIASLLGDEAQVLSMGPQEVLDIKDLDEKTTKKDVLEALRAAAGEGHDISQNVVQSLRKAYGGMQTGFVTLTATTARKILGEHGKIKLGWVNCRIRRVVRPVKCFKCWQYGLLATKCGSTVDRSEFCVKYAGVGHKIKNCQKKPQCVLSTENNPENYAHIAGGSRCATYKEAL